MTKLLLALAILVACSTDAFARRSHHHRRHAHHHHHRLHHDRPIKPTYYASPDNFFHNNLAAKAITEATGQARQAATEVAHTSSSVASEAMRWVGSGNMTGKRGNWCRYFVNFVLRRTGHRYNNDGLARNTGSLGPRSRPAPGVLAYNHGHVDVIVRVEGGRALTVGGNGHGSRVRSHWVSLRKYSGFVRPS
jgi:hypothetical protein